MSLFAITNTKSHKISYFNINSNGVTPDTPSEFMSEKIIRKHDKLKSIQNIIINEIDMLKYHINYLVAHSAIIVKHRIEPIRLKLTLPLNFDMTKYNIFASSKAQIQCLIDLSCEIDANKNRYKKLTKKNALFQKIILSQPILSKSYDVVVSIPVSESLGINRDNETALKDQIIYLSQYILDLSKRIYIEEDTVEQIKLFNSKFV